MLDSLIISVRGVVLGTFQCTDSAPTATVSVASLHRFEGSPRLALEYWDVRLPLPTLALPTREGSIHPLVSPWTGRCCTTPTRPVAEQACWTASHGVSSA